MDTHLVLNAAGVYSAVTLVVDEEREATAVAAALLAAGEDKVHIGIAVGDEALHSVEIPAAIGLVVCCLQAYALQVAACIGFGKVHRHCLARCYAGEIAAALLVGAERVYCLGTLLQAPEVAEACIGACHHIFEHSEDCGGEVKAAIFAGNGDSHEACLAEQFHIVAAGGSVLHSAVFERGSCAVYSSCIGRHCLGTQFAYKFENALIAGNRLLEVYRRKVVLPGFGEALLSHLHDAAQQGMSEIVPEGGVIYVVVHDFF